MSAIALKLNPDAANKNSIRNKDKYFFIDYTTKFSQKASLRLLCAGDAENAKQPGFYVDLCKLPSGLDTAVFVKDGARPFLSSR